MPNSSTGQVAIKFGIEGPSLTITTACAASANAVGEAKNLIDQLDSQISEKLETMSWKDLTLTALNLIEDSNLTRKVLLAIFHTDRLTPELKEDQTVMKFATPLFKYVSQR